MQCEGGGTTWWVLFAFLSCSMLSGHACAADDKLVTFSADISNGTCNVSVSPAELMFPSVNKGKFAAAGTTAQILPLKLTVTQCAGLGGGERQASVKVTGSMASFDANLFRDVGSDATGVGVMLRSGLYSGDLGQFYDVKAALKNGDVTSVPVVKGGVPPDNTNMDYSVGLTNGNGSEVVSSGDVMATLHFTFLYQ